MASTISICCITDNKPGHRSQLDGLLQALSSFCRVDVVWLDATMSLRQQLAAARVHAPQLMLAAGHKTHLSAVVIKWYCRARLVVLMKPTLPQFLFDLCVIPAHDRVSANRRVFITRGAINAIKPSIRADAHRGLILIGGPSRHYGWDADGLIEQLQILLSRSSLQWSLTTSRRTPPEFIRQLQSLAGANLNVVPVEETSRQWLLNHYEHCGTIWVTEDSVSMIYESLTAGACVGVLSMPRLRESRVSNGVDGLIDDDYVTPFAGFVGAGSMRPAPTGFNEAARVAAYVLDRFALGSP